MKYHFACRINVFTKDEMSKNKTFEFQWRYDSNANDPTKQIFTHITVSGYSSFSPFQFDSQNGHGNEGITPKNIAAKSKLMVDTLKQLAANYRTPHYLYPVGGDFQYANPEINFANITLLMNYINARPEVRIIILVSYLIIVVWCKNAVLYCI
jgi:hypothetical protein